MSQTFRQTADKKIDALLNRMYLTALGGDHTAAVKYIEIMTSHPDYQVRESEKFSFDEDKLKKIVSLTKGESQC